jgi:5-methylcytosine-specific restriction endonuclease McrA
LFVEIRPASVGVIGYIETGRNGAVNATPALTIPTLERPQMADKKGNPRRVLSPEQREHRRAYMRAYNQAHKEERLAFNKAWEKANPDKKREQGRLYYTRHRDEVLARTKAQVEAHPERKREYAKKYHVANRAAILERGIDWRKANRPRVNALSRKRYASDPEKGRARTKDWRRRKPEVAKAGQQARRAQKVGARIGCRTAYRAYLKWARAAVSISCYWCGKGTAKGKRHIDHIIPLARGGADATENLCVSCIPCNLHKSDKMPEEFAGQAELKLA